MIIGVSGKIGAGKDLFAANILRRTSGSQPFQIKKFATKLKEVASLLTGAPVWRFEDQEFKKTTMPPEWGGMTYRELLQKIGTEAMRQQVHQNVWVNALMSEYTPSNNWLITDVRFPNEFDAIKDRGGIVVRINRPGQPLSDHESETALDNFIFDHVIENSGTIVDLEDKVKQFITNYIYGRN